MLVRVVIVFLKMACNKTSIALYISYNKLFNVIDALFGISVISEMQEMIQLDLEY
jgi:hypothetical protein